MGGEVIIATLSGMILGCMLGLSIALSIRLLGERNTLPGWPILLFAFVGGMLPNVLHTWR